MQADRLSKFETRSQAVQFEPWWLIVSSTTFKLSFTTFRLPCTKFESAVPSRGFWKPCILSHIRQSLNSEPQSTSGVPTMASPRTGPLWLLGFLCAFIFLTSGAFGEPSLPRKDNMSKNVRNIEMFLIPHAKGVLRLVEHQVWRCAGFFVCCSLGIVLPQIWIFDAFSDKTCFQILMLHTSNGVPAKIWVLGQVWQSSAPCSLSV